MWFSVHVKEEKKLKVFQLKMFPSVMKWDEQVEKKTENIWKEVYVSLLHFTNAQT